jgi:hypothetical protein
MFLFFFCIILILKRLYFLFKQEKNNINHKLNSIKKKKDKKNEMKVVCIICTELLVVNAHISVCSCGHIFHEECLFRWIKSAAQNQSCPQCRAKQTEKTIVKRLYLTEQDITASQANFDLNQCSTENYERLKNDYEDLKNKLVEQREIISAKAKLIEQVSFEFNFLFILYLCQFLLE